MAVRAVPIDSPSDAEQVLRSLDEVRDRTLALVDHLDERGLREPVAPIMSPLVWDLGHIAAYEDLWIGHRHGGMELLRGELAALYDAFETPRAVRGDIDILGPEEARRYMSQVRQRTAEVLEQRGIGDGDICEMVLRHELQHTETMRQAMSIGGLLPAGEPLLGPLRGSPGWLTLAGGRTSIGAPATGFAYDNERPLHDVEVETFQIARRPVCNASWLSFSEGGGYERREWWSDEGWAWKEEYDISHHPAVAAGHPEAPVCHVSWFEADAFARAHDARLPTEAEWERAATWEQQDGSSTLTDIGAVWEWTASNFLPYPGFRAHPYKEYSEVFFGPRYRVLRGGSWATHPRVATRTFRNWDLPQRRQIFAGLRLARDAV
jgi:iron(II)-dependent oxidoreductase